ncbi:MAG: prolyl oligopeptidase family serine peptidase [Vicinamibacterales bacterium]
MRTSRIAALLAVGLLSFPSLLAKAQSPSPALTIDQLIEIKHPSGHRWTPDGRHVWFSWNDGGVNNVWAVAADGRGAPVALTTDPEGRSANGGFWSPDGQRFFYPDGGGLVAVPVTGGPARPAWPSAARASNFTLSPDGARVAFVAGAGGGGGRGAGGRSGGGAGRQGRSGQASTGAATRGSDLIVHAFAGDQDTSVAHVDGRIGSVAWSPDGTRLAFTTSGAGGSDVVVAALAGGATTTVVRGVDGLGGVQWTPDGASLVYATGGGGGVIQHPASPPEVGNKLIFMATERGRGGGDSYLVPASGGTPAPMPAAGGRGGRGGGSNWLDATHLLSIRTSNEGKTRTAEAVSVHGGPSRVLHEETVDRFFSSVNTTANAISPDRRWLLFTADTTGWDQIYVVPTAGGTPVQITKTPGDHWRATWSNDSRHIAWDTNTADRPGDRHIEFATIGDDPSRATITTVTSGRGTNTAPEWSPDDTRILFQHTDAQNSADLYVADAAAGATVTRLTSSMPATIDRSALVAPELVHYPGPDGKPVPAWLFVPKNLDRTRQHPAIVWIHPDGVNQNYDGWHPDRNEAVYYEFHQYLLQQGYVVIAPDYRGSIGYGRDWRNDVYMDVGGKDAKDARMAAGYLKTLGYVDGDRIGVWGLSYGGFFTLLAVTQEPALFRAAVDVAGVADYALYYEDPYHGGWTTSRIGTPEEHPEVYAQASPMSHVDQLQIPLLILHGTADVNVPFLHSVLLIDRLLKAGKGDLVTFMVYPGEFHYFDRSFVVRDAWHRVDDFFRTHLRPGASAAGK